MAKKSDIPVPRRIYHWVNLISIAALAVSGYFINDAEVGRSMHTMRTVHLVFMWIFGINVLLRIYWAFFSRAGDWRKYLAQRWTNGDVWKATINHYFKFKHYPKGMEDRIPQNTVYLLVAIAFLAQILTGLMLYLPANSMLQSFAGTLGGLQSVRHIHLALMWFFAAFVVIHLYMAFSEEFDKVKLMLFSIADEKE
jgi:Ni/Fe-hydrogenase 1 B-type cytochrome subunit